MTLISIVIALIIDRLPDLPLRRYCESGFEHYYKALEARISAFRIPDTVRILLILLPLLAVTLLIQWLLQGLWGGVPAFIFAVIVLLWGLDVTSLSQQVEEYLSARQAGNNDEAQRLAEALSDEKVDSLLAQSSAVTKVILYKAGVILFAPVFWYVLLGPVGVVFYTVIVLLNNAASNIVSDEQKDDVDRIWGVLCWLPFRLLALTYFLSGSFDDGLRAWRKTDVKDISISEANRRVIVSTGCGAIRHEVDDLVAEETADENRDVQWVNTAMHLIFRTAIIWGAALAAMTLAGWIL